MLSSVAFLSGTFFEGDFGVFREYGAGQGSVVQAVARCADSIEPQIEEIRETLRESPVLHAD